MGDYIYYGNIQAGKQADRQMQQGKASAPRGEAQKQDDRDRVFYGHLDKLAHALILNLELLIEISIVEFVCAPGNYGLILFEA